MTSLPHHSEVIVIGAGVAGLSAAHALARRGLSVAVLEAAPHRGGRCVTDTGRFIAPFDRGASWLHSGPINPLAPVATQAGFTLDKGGWSWTHVHTDGRALRSAELADYNQCQEYMWGPVRAAGARAHDRPVSDALPPHPLRETAKEWVAQLHGANADLVSARDVARFDHAEGDWLVVGGLGRFFDSRFADVDVALNSPVSEVDCTGPRVRVSTPSGEIEADRVIVTVSTGVMARGTIRFRPALPAATLGAIEDLPMGLLNKVGLEFAPDWRGAGAGEIADYHAGGEAYTTLHFGFFGTSLAVGFVAGRFADALESEGTGAATAFCLDALRAIFGNDVTRHLRATTETAWRGTPQTLGSYSYARPGGAEARGVLAQPVGDRLFFAGEATVAEAYATVHGAYLSGQRAARAVAQSLGRDGTV